MASSRVVPDQSVLSIPKTRSPNELLVSDTTCPPLTYLFAFPFVLDLFTPRAFQHGQNPVRRNILDLVPLFFFRLVWIVRDNGPFDGEFGLTQPRLHERGRT